MHFLHAINSDISVLIACNKTGGTIKGNIKKLQERQLLKFYILPLQSSKKSDERNRRV